MEESAFFVELDRRVDEVYRSHPEIVDHREDFPWLRGCLGDPGASVWFVAENPSLTQVRKARGDSPELQWSVSPGDKLFREMLCKHGLKNGGSLEPGGWRCYITDVIKSAAIVREWRSSPAKAQLLLAETWAPVLSYEFSEGKPLVVVAVGNKAEELLSHLRQAELLPLIPVPEKIAHYTYIAVRPDRVRRLPAGDPIRVAEWDNEFRKIVALARFRSASVIEDH